jgi:ligand-binding sensor domain-containing protein/signal transduction histidine kinase
MVVSTTTRCLSGRGFRWCTRCICEALLSLVLALFGRAEQLPIRIYRTADGLARDDVSSIATGKNGYLWFGTSGGLSRFDGYEFTNYGPNEGLPNASVNRLLIARDGSLWIGTRMGLCRFNKESPPGSPHLFTIYLPSAVRQAQNIHALAEDRDGSIWCGTDSGLFRLRRLSSSRTQFDQIDLGEPKSNRVRALLVDRQGALWIGAQYGLYRRGPDTQIQRYAPYSGLPSDSIHSFLEDRVGRLWVGTDRGLCLLLPHPDPRGRAVASVYSPDWGWVTDGLETADGRLWFASTNGLWESISGGAPGEIRGFLNYRAANGLSDQVLHAVREDRDSNLWLGSHTGGVMKIARDGTRTYTEADGLHHAQRFGSFLENSAGDLFAITGSADTSFLQRFDGIRFTGIPLRPNGFSNLGWGWNQIAFEDHAGEWWVHSAHGLCRFAHVARFEQLQFTRPKAIYTTREGLASDVIFRLFEDARGDIWISTAAGAANGLSRWQRSTGSLRTFSREPGFPNNRLPTAFREDSTGALWIGFNAGGVARYRDNHFTFLGPDEGIGGGSVFDMFTDHTGRLWIATFSDGLKRIDNPALDHPHVTAISTAEGLSSSEILCITEDLFGRLYIGTGRGLDRLSTDGLIEHFTTADGLALGRPMVAFRDRHGALWFGNLQGFSRWLPEPPRRNSPPPILIRGVRVRGVAQPVSELGESSVTPFSLASDQNQLQFDFVSINFRPAEKRRYQYMLEPADSDWRLTDQRAINYASLPPASYRFLVRAVDSAGVVSPAPATATFTIVPPYWQRGWFRLLALLTGAALLYGAHRYNMNRLLELERVRTRIATDLHDDIGSSLSGIAFLSEAVKQQMGSASSDAFQMASEAAAMARGLARALNDVVWSTDPRHGDLHSLLTRVRQSAAALEAQGIAWSLRAPPQPEKVKLTPEQRHHLYLIFKEALNNIAQHAHCASAGLTITMEDHRLRAEIVDDGCGFGPGQEEHQGNGLRNMKLRAAQLGGQLSADSAAGRGVRLELTVPLK